MIQPLTMKERQIEFVRDQTGCDVLGKSWMSLDWGKLARPSAFVGYWIFGVDSPLVWAALTGIASILPGIGTALVWVPVSLFVFFNHHIAEGIGLALWGAFVIVFVADYILRPKLVGTRMRMKPG